MINSSEKVVERLERVWFWLSGRSPRRLIYFCGIRLAAHATTGHYSDTVVPELTIMEALERWVHCGTCGQVNEGQTGEHPCPECGLPYIWDNEEQQMPVAQAVGDMPRGTG